MLFKMMLSVFDVPPLERIWIFFPVLFGMNAAAFLTPMAEPVLGVFVLAEHFQRLDLAALGTLLLRHGSFLFND